MSTEAADLERLAEAIAQRLMPAVDTSRLWTYEDVGKYFGVSESTARRMAKQPGFPSPRVKQTGDKGSAIIRFVPREIVDWVEHKNVSRAS